MRPLDRIVARMPWTRIAAALERERKAAARERKAAERERRAAGRDRTALTARLDALERAMGGAPARVAETLGERLDTLELAQAAEVNRLAERVADRLQVVERGQSGLTERMRTFETRWQRRDEQLLAHTRSRPVRLATSEFHELASDARTDDRTMLGVDRLYVLWQAVRNTVALGLPSLEIGAFRGGSARFIAGSLRAFAGEERELHVVDTFAGHHPDDTSPTEPDHEPGQFGETSYEDVRDYLADFGSVRVHRARFPENAEAYVPAQVGLVHLDVDLYAPTAAALALLADRTVPGTIIVVDDFAAAKTPGVSKAVDEFLAAGCPFQIWDVDTKQAVLVRR